MQLRNDHRFNSSGSEASDTNQDALDRDDVDFNDPVPFLTEIGFPIPKLGKPGEVRSEARERSKNIFTHHHKLQEILKRHEATTQKRWTGKTRAQRLKILLAAWPNMPTTHRPDFYAFRKSSSHHKSSTAEYTDHFMWPYINQADLLKPKTLLLLLNTRGRFSPPDFAAADGEAMHLGIITHAIVPLFLNQHVFILNGVKKEKDYGTLLAWEEHPDAFDWMYNRKQYLPGEGLLILEAQERLLDFLVNCSLQILHDIDPGTVISDEYPLQAEPPSKSEINKNGYTSLAIVAEEAPYRVPSQLDLGKLADLLCAKEGAVADHLWSLREDPSDFATSLAVYSEHRQERMPDVGGGVHPVFKLGDESLFWHRVSSNIVVEAYLPLEVWSELRRQAQNLQVLQRKYRTKISPSEDLPKDYLFALLKFQHYLNQAVKGSLGQFQHMVPSSPPLRKFFIRDVPVQNSLNKILIMSKPGIKMSDVEGELVWLLRTLWEDGRGLFLTRLPAVVDELDRLLQTEPSAKSLISSYVADTIGNLSMVAECLRQLDIYQPWANGFENAMVDHADDIKKDFARWSLPMSRLLDALSDQFPSSIGKLAQPVHGKFKYPIDKRRTKDNVTALRAAEANLDAFWKKVDEQIHSKAGNLEGTAVRKLLSQPRTLQRTPEWVEPESTLAKCGPDLDVLTRPLSALYFDLEQRTSSTISDPPTSTPLRSKVKTRGSANPPVAASAVSNQDIDTPTGSQPTFTVDARAFKVFRTLFFHPNVTTTPSEIPWNDFLHAMTSTGFLIEKLYGSVWQFKPTRLDVERGIQFHEPHPSGKIPFTMARRHGRRLQRAYGWWGGMFVLKEKGKT